MGTSDGCRLFQGVCKESAAFKLMKQMGWEEGNGLGKNKQGISTHVRVAKKFDNAGIGIAEAKKEAANWTVHTSVFDAILRNLSVKARTDGPEGAPSPEKPEGEGIKEKKSSRKRKSRKEEPGSSGGGGKSSEEETETEKGKRPKKKTKSEAKGKSESDQSSGSSDSEAQEQADSTSRQGALNASKVARPQGRYKKREAGKCVKSYSESDLSAILGIAIAPGAEPSKREPKAEAEGKPAEAAEEAKEVKEERSVKKQKQKESQAKPALSDSSLPVKRKAKESRAKAPPPLPPLPEDWWGHRHGFVRAGALGAGAENRDGGKERGFSEADQEGLYHLVNKNATTGKLGLGIGSQPKKVAGARWKGNKVTFGDDPEDASDSDRKEEGEEDAADLRSESDGEAEQEAETRGGEEKDTARASSSDAKGEKSSKKSGAKSVKWKTILLEILEKKPSGVKVAKLERKALKKAKRSLTSKTVPEDCLKEALQVQLRRLNGKCLVWEGDRVRPRATSCSA